MDETYRDADFIYERTGDTWCAIAGIFTHEDGVEVILYPGERIAFEQRACFLCDTWGGNLIMVCEDVSSETYATSVHPACSNPAHNHRRYPSDHTFTGERR